MNNFVFQIHKNYSNYFLFDITLFIISKYFEMIFHTPLYDPRWLLKLESYHRLITMNDTWIEIAIRYQFTFMYWTKNCKIAQEQSLKNSVIQGYHGLSQYDT